MVAVIQNHKILQNHMMVVNMQKILYLLETNNMIYVGKMNTSVGKALGGQNLNKNTKTWT